MDNDRRTLDELERAVLNTPGHHALRGQLVETFLASGALNKAGEHWSVLDRVLRDEPWVLRLGIEVAEASGDQIRAARLRKQLRNVLTEQDDYWPDDEHSEHPSQDKVQTNRGSTAAGKNWKASNDEGKSSERILGPVRRHLRLLKRIGSEKSETVERSSPLRLGDIAGLSTVRNNLVELLAEVRDNGNGPTTKTLGGSSPWTGGVLLYGPPSCGKAFCGAVVAGELGSPFWLIDLSDDWTTESLNRVFSKACDDGTPECPSVLYLEHLDRLPDTNHDALVRELISILDNGSRSKRILVMGSSTYPWQVSPSIVQKGRLGRVLLVLPPDKPARELFLRDRTHDRAQFSSDDLDWLVAHTEGHSFADLEHLLDFAIAASDADPVLDSDSDPPGSLPRLSHQALRQARQQVPSSSSEWLTIAGHHALIAEASGLYDDLLAYFREREHR